MITSILPYPKVRRMNVTDIARAYATRTIEADVAIRVIRMVSTEHLDMPTCKHGLHTPVLLNSAPICPLCIIDHGYCVPEEADQ